MTEDTVPLPSQVHTYGDTGKYTVTLTLTNEQGCEHDILVAFIMVGYSPLTDFTFKPDTGCKGNPSMPSPTNPYSKQMQIMGYAYDSLDASGNLVANAWADDWQWLDDNDSPIGQGGDTATISPNEPGSAYVRLIASHNGCSGNEVRKENLGYVCPPIATIKDPTDDPSGNPPVYCGFEYIPFINDSKGAIYLRWYAGDTRFPRPGSPHDTVGSSKSPLIKFDTISGDYVQYDDTTGAAVGTGGDWGFEYGPGDYLYDRKGAMTLYLWAMNDSTVYPDVNDTTLQSNPYYNICGYCDHMADQLVLISDAKMNFTVSQGSICQGDSVIFNDSSECTVGIFGWGFKFDWEAASPSRAEDYMRMVPTNPNSPIGRMIPIENYQPDPSYGHGQQLTFTNTNRYRAVLIDTCNFGCERTDTLYFDVYPQSIPDFVSSKDSITFNNGKDIVCINADELLYFQDRSWSPYPYDTAEITSWRWQVGGKTDTAQDPTIQITTYGLHDLKMTITNEYGCNSEKEFQDQVLANLIRPAITFQNNKKDYCNKELVLLTNSTQILPPEHNVDQTYVQYHWDFGDGTDTIIYDYVRQTNRGHSVRHVYSIDSLTAKVYITLRATIVDSITRMPIGCEAEVTDSITINRPIAKFVTDGTLFPCPDATPGGVPGRSITFTEECEPAGDNSLILTWDFGDPRARPIIGVRPDVDTVINTYREAGQFSVTLVAQQNFGTFTCNDTMFMESLIDIAGPVGDLTYSPLGGCKTLRTTFYQAASKDPMYSPDSMVLYPGPSGDRNTLDLKRDYTIYLYSAGGAWLPAYSLYKTVIFNGEQHTCIIQRACEDTIYVIDLQPSFEINELYCPDEEIDFINTSTWIPNYLPYDSILWEFNNGNVSQMYDGNTKFGLPGIYDVTLTMSIPAADTFCLQRITNKIEVMEIPDIFVTPDTAISCDGLDVVFFADTLSDDDKSHIVDYNWRFINLSDTSVADVDTLTTDNTLTLMFNKSGNYECILDVTFLPEGCAKTYYDTVIVFAHESPIAEFEPNPEEGQVDEEFQFIDKSIITDGNIVKWLWNFGDGNTDSSETNGDAIHAYSDTSGYVSVTLYITDEYGCKAEVTHQVLVVEKLAFPNIFTPNGNCGNRKCEFRPLEDKGFFKEFKLEIYDRWGMLVWSRHCESGSGGSCPDYQGDNFWWDGTSKQGNPVVAGVYYWVVYATPLSEAAPFIQNGSITVTR